MKLMKTNGLSELNNAHNKITDDEKRSLLRMHDDLVKKREEVFKQEYISKEWLEQNSYKSFRSIAKSVSSMYEEEMANTSLDFIIVALKLYSLRTRTRGNMSKKRLRPEILHAVSLNQMSFSFEIFQLKLSGHKS